MKNEKYISWDEYFMGVALLSSKRSKDPSTQVGACIVNSDKRIIGIGYNGFPRGISDDEFPWGKDSDNELETKYPYVVHAEANAILNATQSLKDAVCYVTLFPCNECAKLLIQSGIKEVVYLSDKHAGKINNLASKRLLLSAGVSLREFKDINIEITK